MARKSTIGVWLIALALVPFRVTDAQQTKKVPRIGYLSALDPARESARTDAIRLAAMRELGYIEGQNIASEYRYAEGKGNRQPELASELVRLKVDLIVVAGTAVLTRAVKNATKTIPIVMVGGGVDPVEAGPVESLARPGGNVTGVTNLKPRTRREAAGAAQKKPFPNLPVSRFSTIRLIRPVYSS
jgi:putative ABC transport system substrate-binding protein